MAEDTGVDEPTDEFKRNKLEEVTDGRILCKILPCFLKPKSSKLIKELFKHFRLTCRKIWVPTSQANFDVFVITF